MAVSYPRTNGQDCQDLDGDGYGNPQSPDCVHPEEDCDDSNPDIHPGAFEECGEATCNDGIDNDCNGAADEMEGSCQHWCPSAGQASTLHTENDLNTVLSLLIPAAALLLLRCMGKKK